MKKNLKTKVILSVLAGTMMFGGTALGAEIPIDGTNIDTTQDNWYESYGLKKSGSVLVRDGIYPVIPENKTDTLNLKKFKKIKRRRIFC